MHPLISCVICTFNRSDLLCDCLNSLSGQHANSFHFEVLLIDNNSTDNTKEILGGFKSELDIKYYFEPKIGLSNARNRGIKESASEYIAFVDDDAVVSSGWIAKAQEIIKQDKPVIFGGPILPYYKTDKREWFQDKYETRHFGVVRKKLKSGENLSGSNIFFKREVFSSIGFFDPGLGMRAARTGLGEETQLQEIAKRNGVDCYYYPDLVVRHLVPDHKMRLRHILKRNIAAGRAARAVYGKGGLGIGIDIYYLVREVIKFLVILCLLPFRDRRKYPYWQNYFIYASAPVTVRLGRLRSYFSQE